ncbi:MAG: hypothetical protein RL217_1025 [Pseudomonadota bacterium]|jgi:flagellar M-ring protein FliF
MADNSITQNGPELDVLPEMPNASEPKLHPALTGFNRLSIVRQMALIAGVAVVLAIIIALVMWDRSPSYKPLITRLQDYNAQDVVEILQREGIDFEIDANHEVLMVKSSDLHKARMKLAGSGVLEDKSVGLEILEKDNTLGTSQFIENARYRRGLEGELARTISSLRPVRNARVHLALPKQSVFVRDQRKPRASVFVELYAGGKLNREQVESIINLVASSISEMERSDVSVVDQYGNLLSKPEDKGDEMQAKKQLDYTKQVQETVAASINRLLQPVLGEQNYKAEVAADIDFSVQEQSQELFNPDLIALRSEQTLSEEKEDKVEGGIPGALSNQPPAQVTAPDQALGAGAGSSAPKTKRNEATRNYEVDRTLSYQQQQGGRLKRLTVGVVVNDRASVDANGKPVMLPWSENDLKRIEILVKDAVGFNAARGDSVTVVNSSFINQDTQIEEAGFWTQPWFWDIVKQVLAGIFILVLIFGVIRPTVKSLANRGKDEASVLLDELEDAEAGLDDEKVTLAGVDEFLLPGASESFERQLDALKGLIAEDPARVAQVVIRWINEGTNK